MFKGKRDNMPPHVCSVAQRAYWNLLTQRQDQTLLPLGRSGAGKTTCCQSALEYLVGTAGSVDNRVSGTAAVLLTCLCTARAPRDPGAAPCPKELAARVRAWPGPAAWAVWPRGCGPRGG